MSFLWPKSWVLGLFSRGEEGGGKGSEMSVLLAFLLVPIMQQRLEQMQQATGPVQLSPGIAT